jgi:hypothetical protein
MIHAVLSRHNSKAQMQLLRSRCKKNIYESKQDNWHPAENRHLVEADRMGFDCVFVWQHDDANTVPALLQTHITPTGTHLIKPYMILVQSNTFAILLQK